MQMSLAAEKFWTQKMIRIILCPGRLKVPRSTQFQLAQARKMPA